MKDPAGEFLRYLDHQRGASRHTLRSYAADLSDFNAFLAREKVGGLAEADARAIRGWLASLHDRKLARSSIARKLATVRSCLKYLARRGVVELNAARQIRSPKLPKRLPSFLPKDESKNLLDAEVTHYHAAPRVQDSFLKTQPVPWSVSAMLLEAVRYQTIFRRDGPKREFEFDVPYKTAYDIAIAQPTRPIYLQDGKWGPGYMDAMWYATIERRPQSEFVHLPDRGRAPRGSVVISSGEPCQNCEIIKRSGVYLVYRAK